MFEVVGGCAGRRLGRLVACWWTTFACSRVWPRLVAVVWVVSVVWVAYWWTTFVVLGGLVECSRVWVEVVAADLVVSRDGEARLACW